jgi:hypothetical protein
VTTTVDGIGVLAATERAVAEETDASSSKPRQQARARFPARPVAASWAVTQQDRDRVLDRLSRAPFVRSNFSSQSQRVKGLAWLLNGLQEHDGETWQQQWLASGAETAETAWRQVFLLRADADGNLPEWRKSALTSALTAMVSGDFLRPSLTWLADRTTGQGTLVRELARSRDPGGFARLRELCDNDPDVSAVAASHTLHRAALIIAAKGPASTIWAALMPIPGTSSSRAIAESG